MKKLKFIIFLFSTICALNIYAYDFEIDGIYYDITSLSKKEVAVTYNNSNYNSYSGAVEIPSSVSYNGTNYNVTSIGEKAFCNCRNLVTVNIPTSVTDIGVKAFHECYNLTQVKIPNTVTSIGDFAFCNCYCLFEITIPNSVISIGNYCFNNGSLIEVTIPNSVTSIGDFAFYAGLGLTKVTIGSSVASIGDQAFGSCPSLLSIYVDPLNKHYVSIDGILFSTDLKTLITYPGAKEGAYKIPETVTTINGAFSGCEGLTEVTIPLTVTSIGDMTFYGCISLTEVTIPNCVTSIGEAAFEYCSSLTSVIIPNSVTSIGRYAFGDCSSLKNFYSYAITPPRTADTNSGYNYTFANVNLSDAKLHVPNESKSSYEGTNPWRRFGKIFILDEGTTGIADILTDEEAVNIYNFEGVLLHKDASKDDIRRLASGYYVIVTKTKSYKVRI